MTGPLVTGSLGLIANVKACNNLGRVCEMLSRDTGSPAVRFIEQCRVCGWVDPAALDAWGTQIVIEAMASRAQRIAVAAELEPFRFVQGPDQKLPLLEMLTQALAAASRCWDVELDPAKHFNSKRAGEILGATLAEVERAVRMGLTDGETYHTRESGEESAEPQGQGHH